MTRRLINVYDDSILEEGYNSALFGPTRLDQRGLLANTWVIVTSDHGEHFGEHHLFGHANSLYRQVLHVPLLIVQRPGDHLTPNPCSP